MGQLSVAKTLSGVISNLLASVSSIFQPNLTIYYAKNQINELIKELKMSMKVTGLFANIPLTYLIVFGSIYESPVIALDSRPYSPLSKFNSALLN